MRVASGAYPCCKRPRRRGLAVGLRHLRQHRVQVERGGLLARRELDEVGELRRDQRLHLVQLGHVIDHPVQIGVGVEFGPFERVATEADYVRQAKLHERLGPLSQRIGALYRQIELPVANPHRDELAVIAEVYDGVSRALRHLSGEVWDLIVAVEMDVEGLAVDRAAVEELFGDVGVACDGKQRRKHVDVRNDAIQDRAGLDLARPADEAGHAPSAFPVGVLLARNGLLAPSGQVSFSGPLSVEYMTMVLSAMPSSSTLSSIMPICSSWVTIRSL